MSNGNGGSGGGGVDAVSTSIPLSEPLVYVGPISTKLGLSYQQYYTELTDVVKTALDANPALNLLLLPLSQYSSMRDQITGGQVGYIAHAIEMLTAQGVL